MSMKLIATKRLYYPRGPGGKEYQRGETFEAVSERDKKALLLVRAATEEPVTPLRVADPQPVRRGPGRPPKPRPEAEGEIAGGGGGGGDTARTYQRRDMTAEDPS